MRVQTRGWVVIQALGLSSNFSSRAGTNAYGTYHDGSPVLPWPIAVKGYGDRSLNCGHSQDDRFMSLPRVNYSHDDELPTSLAARPVPPRTSGGGTGTRDEAERDCLEAIDFALHR